MNDSEKLDLIIKMLKLQRIQDRKWKPLTEYLDSTGRTPEQELEALMGLDKVFEDREKRLNKM